MGIAEEVAQLRLKASKSLVDARSRRDEVNEAAAEADVDVSVAAYGCAEAGMDVVTIAALLGVSTSTTRKRIEEGQAHGATGDDAPEDDPIPVDTDDPEAANAVLTEPDAGDMPQIAED